jgi:hypothetical protein
MCRYEKATPRAIMENQESDVGKHRYVVGMIHYGITVGSNYI